MARRRVKGVTTETITLDGDVEELSTPRDDRIESDLIRELKAKMDTARSWEARSAFSAPVELPDKSFRTKTIDHANDFTLHGVRIGARGQIIFKFKPIEPKDYVFMELDEVKVTVFEGFIEAAICALGYIPGPKLVGSAGRAVSWDQAKQMWKKQRRQELRDQAKSAVKAEEAKKQAEENRKLESYVDNPMFGSW